MWHERRYLEKCFSAHPLPHKMKVNGVINVVLDMCWLVNKLRQDFHFRWSIPLKAKVFTCECLQFSNQQKVCVCIQRVSESCGCVAPCFVTVCQAWANSRIQTFNSQSNGSYISQSRPQTPLDRPKSAQWLSDAYCTIKLESIFLTWQAQNWLADFMQLSKKKKKKSIQVFFLSPGTGLMQGFFLCVEQLITGFAKVLWQICIFFFLPII